MTGHAIGEGKQTVRQPTDVAHPASAAPAVSPKHVAVAIQGLLRVERMGLYGRLLELISEEEAAESRLEPWGEVGHAAVRELRERVQRALEIEAEYGRGCLLNLEDPLVDASLTMGRSVTSADVESARRFREQFPSVYGAFARANAQTSAT